MAGPPEAQQNTASPPGRRRLGLWLGALATAVAASGFFALEATIDGFWLPQGLGARAIPLAEVAYFGAYLVLGVVCWTGLTALLDATALGGRLTRLAMAVLDSPERLALGCALGAFACSAAFRHFVLHDQALADDELTYDFIASTLLEGRISNVPSIPPEFLRNQFVFATEAAWHGKYPLGHPALLALGRLLGAQALVVPVLGGLGVWLTFAIGKRLVDARTAALGALLLALSPQYIWTNATQLSQPTAMICTLVAALSLLRLIDDGALRWAALCGAALGYGMLTRPVPMVFFVPALAVGYLKLLPRDAWRTTRGRRVLEVATTGATLAIGVGALMWLNQTHWGHPLRSGAEVVNQRTGAFSTQEAVVSWSVGGSLLRENFWLHGWPVSLVLVPFARFRRGAALVWSLFAGEIAYRVLVPKTVYSTTGPIYLFECVPLLCLASAAGARRVVERLRELGTAPAAARQRIACALGAGCLVGATMFVPVTLEAVEIAVQSRFAVPVALQRAGYDRALLFASALVPPESGLSWAYYTPNPSPDMNDDLIYVRYLPNDAGYQRMHALWRTHFPDRPAVIVLLTPEGRVELRELSTDPNVRPTLPPRYLFASPTMQPPT